MSAKVLKYQISDDIGSFFSIFDLIVFFVIE